MQPGRLLKQHARHRHPASVGAIPCLVLICVLITVLAGCTYPAPEPTPPDIPEPPATAPAASAFAGTEYIERTFEWTYWRFDDITWEWSVRIPTSLYEDYSSRPRPQTADYTLYAKDDGDREIIEDLANTLLSYAESLDLDEYETLHFIATFVQQLEYAFDIDTKGLDDYGRYPVETLVDQHGDCEDASILLGKVLLALGYDVVMVLLPHHMALGIRESDKFAGTYYKHNGVKYFYLESTGTAGRIGMVPDEYAGQAAYIYDFSPRPIITHDWTGQRGIDAYDIEVTIENHGTVALDECSVLVGFEAGVGQLWHATESEPFPLHPGQRVEVTLSLPIPHTRETRLLVYVVHDGKSIDASRSQWFTE